MPLGIDGINVDQDFIILQYINYSMYNGFLLHNCQKLQHFKMPKGSNIEYRNEHRQNVRECKV